MADQGVSSLKTSMDLYKDPRSLFLVIACTSMIAGRIVDVCGKNCSQYVNLAKVSGVFGSFFSFWDCGSVLQSAYGGLRDVVKTVGYDYHYKKMTPEAIRRETNNAMTIQGNPYWWGAERAQLAALNTFASFVLSLIHI